MPKRLFTERQVAQALKQAGGIHAAAARILEAAGIPCTGRTIGNYVARSPRLQQAVSEAVDINLDLCESTVLELAVKQKNLTALIWYMKIKGKHRGYTERTEVTGANGGAVAVRDETDYDFENMSKEDLDAFLAGEG